MDRTNIISVFQITRKAKKYRQRDVARLSGLTQAELSNIESNKIDIRLSTLKKIADALDLKIIAVSKEKLEDIENLLIPAYAVSQKEQHSILLDQYGISDEDD